MKKKSENAAKSTKMTLAQKMRQKFSAKTKTVEKTEFTPVTLDLKKRDIKRQPELNTRLPQLPFGIWCNIFTRLSLHDGANLALVAKGLSERWHKFQFDTQEGCRYFLLERGVFSSEQLDSAESAGIQVNYIRLYRLFRINYAEAQALADLADDDLAPIAAICGDLGWLHNHLKPGEFASILKYLCFSLDESTVKGLLTNGYVNPNDIENTHESLCYFAALGANISILEAFAYTYPKSLEWLLMSGHLVVALEKFDKLLALKGKDEISQMSLEAAKYGHFYVSDYLHEHYGARLNAEDRSSGACQIHYAAYHDDKARVVRLLGEHDTFPVDRKDLTPVHYAAQGGARRTLLYLLEEYPEYQKQDGCNYANLVTQLIMHGHTSLVQLLQNNYRANLRVHDDKGNTLLFRAAQGGKWNSFACLRDDNQIPCTVNKNGDLPVFWALLNGRARFVEKYVEAYGDECLSHGNNDGNGAAYYLLCSKDFRFVTYCINKYHIDLNGLNTRQRTPIHELAHVHWTNDGQWDYIAQCVQKFDQHLSPGWQLQPDVNGTTFLDVVVENSQQDKFPQFFEANNTLK